MNNRLSQFFKIVCAIALLVGLSGCEQQAENQTAERVVAVRARVVASSDETVTRIFTGSLEGREQAIVYAKISESVQEIFVKEGDVVRKDQPLLAFDRSSPSSQVREAESLYRNAEKHYNKMKRLYDEGAISESELDAAETDYQVKKASYESARQLIEVLAPIAGVVTSIDVSPGEFASVGQELATVARIDTLRVRFEAQLKDLEKLSPGSRVTIRTDEVNEAVDGTVVSVSKSADRLTRAFEVDVTFPNKNSTFRPGMFVRIEAIVAQLDDVISIPRDAVIRLNGNQVVFLAKGDRAARREVLIGAELEGQAVITEGLSAGDTVIVVGQNYLEDNLKINVTDIE